MLADIFFSRGTPKGTAVITMAGSNRTLGLPRKLYEKSCEIPKDMIGIDKLWL